MSNVLIGIIGVILFIGLALAGALFLGPRFQEATQNSKASANIQAVAQVSNAIDMYRVQEGTAYDPGFYPSNLVGTYLKSVPSIQGGGAIAFRTTSLGAGSVLIASSSLDAATGNTSRQMCEAIVKQTTGAATVPTEPVSQTGCFYNGARYLVYARVDL